MSGRATATGPSYHEVYAFASLRRAFDRARRAKRGKGGEPRFYRDLEANLLVLSDALRRRTFRPDPYRYFRLRGTKERIVSEASFRDRVVHHALVAALEPHFERRFVRHSYACRRGKGMHRAVGEAQRLAQRLPYYLRMDVRRYFDHVDHAMLLSLLAEPCQADERTGGGLLWLCDRLLGNARVPGTRPDERRGLPIGNLTSQFWANVYLDPLDHLARDELGMGAYLRYMDDILVFGHRKEQLWEAAGVLRAFAEGPLRLEMKAEATIVAPVGEGVPWLGFRVFPGTVRLDHHGRRRLGRRLAASNRRAGRTPLAEDDEAARAASVCGHAKVGDTRGLRRGLVARLDGA